MPKPKREPSTPKPSSGELPKEAELLLKKDYSYLKELNPEGWCEELTRLYKLSVENDLGLHKEDPNILIIRKAGAEGEPGQTTIGQIGVPTVQFKARAGAGVWIPQEHLPALIVNVNAPDKVILKELERTLKEVRRYIGPPVAKRGRYALNSRFDKNTFAKWRSAKIVRLADLLVCNAKRKARAESPFPEHLIGKRLGMAKPKNTSDAKKQLKKALASLPALVAQIAQDMVPAQIAQQMIAAKIEKDVK